MRELIEKAERWMTRNYRPAPVVLARGQGTQVWDAEGNRYLDLCAGIAVCVLGHSHPEVTAAIQRQAATLIHVSNLFYNPLQIELAEKLSSRSLGGRAFFCNSGAEANEALLKISRRTMQRVRGETQRVGSWPRWSRSMGAPSGRCRSPGRPSTARASGLCGRT